ncbi:putative chaperone DnaJ, HSP40/DnaJ peptide-binding protein [Helianthus annuus]|nr:putative chaperone DnaJ, HSP40/DnaJ peptide-binding protein [Helianthus annuus]
MNASCTGFACTRMGGIRKACKSFLSKHHFGKKSHRKHQSLQVDVNDNGKDNGDGDRDRDGDETRDVTSPKVTISRTASTGFLPRCLSKSTSERRSKTPGRIRPGNSLLRSFSRKNNSFHNAPSFSKRTNSTIIYSNANGLQKPPDMVKRLECTLEELCFGCIKRVNITRDILTSEGQIIQEEEVLTIKVKPGWTKGTKITFEGMGNETPGTSAADITFVIDEKPHPVFKRNGNDLEVTIELPLVDALTGCTLTVPSLGAQESCLTIDDIITPGYRKTIPGQGMPLPKEEETRGNLNIKFSVQFPQHLTEEQRSECFNILQDSC